MSLKVGLIGAGWAAQTVHAPSLVDYKRRRRGIKLFGICDIDAQRVVKVQEQFGFAEGFNSVEVMAHTGFLDAAIVAVSVPHTAQVAATLLKYEIPMLVEKPPALTRRAAENLHALIERSGGRVMVGFNRRYAPIMQRLREEIRAAAEAGPQIARALMLRNNRADADFTTTAIHAIDALRYLCDDDYQRLDFSYGHCGPGGESASFHAIGQTFRGTTIEMTIVPQAGLTVESYSLHADGKTFMADLAPGSLDGNLSVFENGKRNMLTVPAPSDAQHDRQGFYQEVAAFLDAIRSGADLPGPTVGECVQSVAVMEAMAQRRSRYVAPK